MGQVGLGHKVISFKLKRNINGEVKVRLGGFCFRKSSSATFFCINRFCNEAKGLCGNSVIIELFKVLFCLNVCLIVQF